MKMTTACCNYVSPPSEFGLWPIYYGPSAVYTQPKIFFLVIAISLALIFYILVLIFIS